MFLPSSNRIMKSLKKNGGYVTIGELSLDKRGKYNSFYSTIKDWNNNEIKYETGLQGIARDCFQNKMKAVVILPLGLECTPVIVSTNPKMIEYYQKNNIFISSYNGQLTIGMVDNEKIRKKHVNNVSPTNF